MQYDSAVRTYLGDIDFDPDALKKKYLDERDKRVRKEGIAQYIEVTADFSHYEEDPYTPNAEREPLFDDVDVVIIGAGFGGLLTGARLREAGFENIRVIDKAGDFGGTWYWNRYPGAMCDVESYCYLPLLEELNYIPKHKYSFAPEILEHSKNIAKHFNLYDNACLQTAVTAMYWNEDEACWIIETDRGDKMRTQFVAMANGPLSRPKLPGIPGINEFKGHTFHTSRWDYAYTGGDSSGGLRNLKNKKVGIIGTGATAVQCIPHLGEWAERLYVFQRTPSSIDVRNNRETDPDWASSLKPGWQQERMDNFNTMVSGGDSDVDMVHDGWTDIYRNLTGVAAKFAGKELGRRLTSAERAELMELSDYRKMNAVRQRVDEVVHDDETAELLKPWYRQFCKRPCFHDEYLPTYNRENVHLVDTNGQGVERLTERGVVVNGQEYELDCLIFATGFEVGTGYTRRSGYDIIGQDNRHLSEHWEPDITTFQGLMTHGFPNCFFLGFTQTAITVNVPHALNEQAKHTAHIISQARQKNASTVQPTQEAETAYVDEVKRLARVGARFYAECTPGYYNSEGAQGNKKGFFTNMHGAGPIAFYDDLRKWRSTGDLQGLMLR
ncbi:MAG: NAD(P)/FAD-dependent oxidoreductase [Pseudomonadota bacterium]